MDQRHLTRIVKKTARKAGIKDWREEAHSLTKTFRAVPDGGHVKRPHMLLSRTTDSLSFNSVYSGFSHASNEAGMPVPKFSSRAGMAFSDEGLLPSQFEPGALSLSRPLPPGILYDPNMGEEQSSTSYSPKEFRNSLAR